MPRSPAPFLSLLAIALTLASCATPAPPHKRPGSAQQGRPSAGKTPGRVVADGVAVPGGRRHTVKAGDTGLAIARAYGVSWRRIAEANGLDRDSVLRVGQQLFIPTGRSGSSHHRRPAPAPTPPAAPKPAAPVPTLSWPVDGRVILSDFGPKPGGRVNDGINIKALRGATVRAAADGEVIYVGDAIHGFGLLMLVCHANGYVTAYGHLEAALASRGDKVQRGQPIARAGSSGEAREPQLLFQLRHGRQAINPLPYLPK